MKRTIKSGPKIMNKESLNDELTNLSPLLLGQKRQGDGFRVPEGYFEGLEDAVFDKIAAMEGQKQTFRPAPKKDSALRARLFKPYLAMAAAAVFVLVLAAKWLMTPKTVPADSGSTVALEATEEALIEAYILENIRDFEAEQLADVSEVNASAEPSALPDKQPEAGNSIDNLSPEELELLLKEMSEEELESLL